VRVAILDFTITVAGVGPGLAVPAVARALRESGIEHACVEVDGDAAAAGLLHRWLADRLVLRGSAGYSPDLDTRVAAALGEVAPTAGIAVDWDAHDADLAARSAAGRHVYRLARQLGALDGGAVPARVALALLDPDRYQERFTPSDFDVPLAVGAFLDALVDAEAITGVDWKATRAETAEALGPLRILPGGSRRIREAVPQYDDFVARCVAAESRGGPSRAAADPDEGLQYAVVDTVHSALADLGIDLLYFENGDTPGYLAVAPEIVADLLVAAEQARMPFAPYRPGA